MLWEACQLLYDGVIEVGCGIVCNNSKSSLTLGAMMGRDDSREAPIVLFQDLHGLSRAYTAIEGRIRVLVNR